MQINVPDNISWKKVGLWLLFMLSGVLILGGAFGLMMDAPMLKSGWFWFGAVLPMPILFTLNYKMGYYNND